MKTNFTNFPQNTIKFFALAIFALLLVNCSNDDGAPEVFEFKEFENLSEMPDVDDPEIEFAEPDLGSVNESEATKAMIADFESGSGDLSDATKENLTAVGNFSDGLTTDFQDEAQALDAAKIEELLNATELTGDYAALAAELETLPASVAALFPTIAFSADYNRAQDLTKEGIVINDLMANLMSQAGTGPCFDIALASYNKAMEAPIAKRDEQLNTFSSNLESRLVTVIARFDDRQTNLHTIVDNYRSLASSISTALLGYANSADDNDLKLQLRQFALLNTIQSRTVINEFEKEATDLIEDRQIEETETVENRNNETIEEVNSNFDAVKAEADALLTAAYAKCHNQGSGS
ncbi:hypothetical protein [Gillisia sp. CAL575]|uniref:hypothetical protein n=1 Tax=Gillisia sp. CAL575 TaxID=985255 RepID=UPI00039E636F|nr:hypothetical protein [Gillisia sp. CAL575]